MNHKCLVPGAGCLQSVDVPNGMWVPHRVSLINVWTDQALIDIAPVRLRIQTFSFFWWIQTCCYHYWLSYWCMSSRRVCLTCLSWGTETGTVLYSVYCCAMYCVEAIWWGLWFRDVHYFAFEGVENHLLRFCIWRSWKPFAKCVPNTKLSAGYNSIMVQFVQESIGKDSVKRNREI